MYLLRQKNSKISNILQYIKLHIQFGLSNKTINNGYDRKTWYKYYYIKNNAI